MDKGLFAGGLIALLIGGLLVRLKMMQAGGRREQTKQARADLKEAKNNLDREQQEDAAAESEFEEVVREADADVESAGRGGDPVGDLKRRAGRLRAWMDRRSGSRRRGGRDG